MNIPTKDADRVDVTVIIPFRNRGVSRLRRAIESLAAAAPGLSVQVIVSDLGSDDPGTVRSVCERSGAEWLRLESDHWNKSVCINRALAVSRGEYVQVHDVDMIWTPGSLAAHLDQIKAHPKSFINSQVWDLPEDLTEYALTTAEPDWALFREKSVSHSRWGHGLVLAPRSALLRIGGLDERMHTYGGEDLDLTKRLKRTGLRQEWVGHRGDELFHIWHDRIPSMAAKDSRVAAAIKKNRDLYYSDDSVIRNVPTPGQTDEPLVSVVIATRNRSAYLAESIYSALYQTVRSLEVLVIDDGSTDDTEAVVRQIEDPRVRYVHQDATGVAAARNRGTKEARGFYIAVLDDDDLMRPDRLEIQLGCLDGAAQGCVGNLLHFYDSDGQMYYFSDARPTTAGALPTGGFAGHPGWLVEKSLLEQIPYDESLSSAIDNNVALRALRSGFRFRHCNQFVTLRRIHEKQVTMVDGQQQKLGARLTHVWFQGGVDPQTMKHAQNNYSKTTERPVDAVKTTPTMRPWLPDHLVTRTVQLRPSDMLKTIDLPLPHRAGSAVSIISGTGEQVGSPLQVSGVTWPQLAALRRKNVPHHVIESDEESSGIKRGLTVLPPTGEDEVETGGEPLVALSDAVENLIQAERDKLQPDEFLVCWEPADPQDGVDEPELSSSHRPAVSFSLSNSAGTRRIILQRSADFADLVETVGRASGLIKAYSPTAKLHLPYIHRKAIEMGLTA